MDEELHTIFLLVIENAVIANFQTGVEHCLYCSWEHPVVPTEEVNRLLAASPEEHAAWWAEMQAQNQHDEECIVVLIRKRLRLPNPRTVYP